MVNYTHNHTSKLAMTFLALVFLVAIGYASFEARLLFLGPQIAILSPLDASTVHNSFITIKGTGSHVVELRMNGRQIPINERGAFEEPIALLPGYNKVVLSATDKRGVVTEKDLDLVYVPIAASETITAAISSVRTNY
jgi:hypothetical protein